jgi:hypothetical protein
VFRTEALGGKPCKTVRWFVVEIERTEWNYRSPTVLYLHVSFGELHTHIYLHRVTVYMYKFENCATVFMKFHTGQLYCSVAT